MIDKKLTLSDKTKDRLLSLERLRDRAALNSEDPKEVLDDYLSLLDSVIKLGIVERNSVKEVGVLLGGKKK